ncbi:hypothetical protein [Caudoviricetes sp.]|nr:hypothetical protein [Caudoviricetes sp.]UOF82763.1 hypothetical protein [Caudoviricetes sp.]
MTDLSGRVPHARLRLRAAGLILEAVLELVRIVCELASRSPVFWTHATGFVPRVLAFALIRSVARRVTVARAVLIIPLEMRIARGFCKGTVRILRGCDRSETTATRMTRARTMVTLPTTLLRRVKVKFRLPAVILAI